MKPSAKLLMLAAIISTLQIHAQTIIKNQYIDGNVLGLDVPSNTPSTKPINLNYDYVFDTVPQTVVIGINGFVFLSSKIDISLTDNLLMRDRATYFLSTAANVSLGSLDLVLLATSDSKKYESWLID